MKYTFLSKWTVLLLTLLTGALVALGYYLAFGFNSPDFNSHPFYAIGALLLGLLVYAFAWLIALLDSLQERKWAWSILLVLLLPIWIGPLIYSIAGPRNTR